MGLLDLWRQWHSGNRTCLHHLLRDALEWALELQMVAPERKQDQWSCVCCNPSVRVWLLWLLLMLEAMKSSVLAGVACREPMKSFVRRPSDHLQRPGEDSLGLSTQ